MCPTDDSASNQSPIAILLDLAMRLVLAAAGAELLELKTLSRRLLVLRIRIVPLLALLALERNDFARHWLSRFSSSESQKRGPA